MEAKWLRGLLVESREPNRDPVYEMMGGVVRFRANLESIGLRPQTAQIDFSVGAWDVIMRSPITSTPGVGPVLDLLGYWPTTPWTLMGISTQIDDQLPDPIVVFRDSSGDVLRLVILTDSADRYLD